MRWLALGLGIVFSLAIWLAGFALVDLIGTWFLVAAVAVATAGFDGPRRRAPVRGLTGV